MYLLPGIIGFIFFILFDLNKIYWKSRIINLFFILGSILLGISTAYSILQSGPCTLFSQFGAKQLLLIVALLISGAALVYALFFALPFDDTYVQSNTLPLVNKGIYGACRHPGFWMLLLVYLFIAFLFPCTATWQCFLTYNICNFLYIIIQDVYIFPQYITGYNEYKKSVPFLLPTRQSIKNAFCK